MSKFTVYYLSPLLNVNFKADTLKDIFIKNPFKFKIVSKDIDSSLRYDYMKYIESIGNRIPFDKELDKWLDTAINYYDKYVITKHQDGYFELAELQDKNHVMINIYNIDKGKYYKKNY
jgi:hypothetical protein